MRVCIGIVLAVAISAAIVTGWASAKLLLRETPEQAGPTAASLLAASPLALSLLGRDHRAAALASVERVSFDTGSLIETATTTGSLARRVLSVMDAVEDRLREDDEPALVLAIADVYDLRVRLRRVPVALASGDPSFVRPYPVDWSALAGDPVWRELAETRGAWVYWALAAMTDWPGPVRVEPAPDQPFGMVLVPSPGEPTTLLVNPALLALLPAMTPEHRVSVTDMPARLSAVAAGPSAALASSAR